MAGAPQVIAWLEERALGKKQVNYKLRDWLFARQRCVLSTCVCPQTAQDLHIQFHVWLLYFLVLPCSDMIIVM